MIIQIAIWVIVSLFLGGTLIWAALLGLGMLTTESDRVYGADDVQVRILTIGDAEQTVRRTANKATDHFDDVHIVSERSMLSPPNATVHVVPDEFESEASAKGRAMDWASQHIPCNREYVLYLDEDTIVAEFDGLPDEDIVQFLEQPMKTDSRLSWYIEVARVGFQQEMHSFRSIRYPLYCWGGGVAIRTVVEQDVGWHVDSVTEDTVFSWRAVKNGYSYTTTTQRFRNQAPPSIRELVAQRRRWFSGSMRALSLLPGHWVLFLALRHITGAASIAGIAIIGAGLFGIPFPLVIAVPLLLPLVVQSVYGALPQGNWVTTLWLVCVTLLLFPVLHAIQAIGIIAGMLDPSESFDVTEKR